MAGQWGGVWGIQRFLGGATSEIQFCRILFCGHVLPAMHSSPAGWQRWNDGTTLFEAATHVSDTDHLLSRERTKAVVCILFLSLSSSPSILPPPPSQLFFCSHFFGMRVDDSSSE